MTIAVTTSWDDGHVLDMRLADLLDRHGLAATFYVASGPVRQAQASQVSEQQLRELAGRFEIGGHTVTHRPLPELEPDESEAEILDGKKQLEDIVQRQLRSFCYPGGFYASEHVEMVRRSGFLVARTTVRHVTSLPSDPLQAGTTVQACRHLRDLTRLWRSGSTGLARVRGAFASIRASAEWDRLAVQLFDGLLAKDSGSSDQMFHLWGHSWEIEEHGDWARLENVLRHIGSHREARFVTNSALADGG